MKSIKLFSAFLVVFYLISISGCKKDKQTNSPALPPSSSMEMDFTTFPAPAAKAAQLSSTSTYTNFGTAYAVVTYWSVAAIAYTALPTYAFKAVINNGNPTYDNVNGQWIWSKEFSSGLDHYLAELDGKVAGDSVIWQMYITQVGVGDKFMWFDGVSHSGYGWWKLYSKTDGAALLLNWEKESDQVGSLTYTNIIAGDANNGAYIKFASTSATSKYFNIKIISDTAHPSNNNVLYTIEWDKTTKAGDIKWNGGQLCWDTNLADTTCQ